MITTDLLRFFSTDPQRVKPIYYTLRGKKTFSNLLAAKKHGYLIYFHSAADLTWGQFEHHIGQLQREQLIQPVSKNEWCLTAKGQAWCVQQPPFLTKYYNGLTMPKLNVALAQLHLAIQVLSQFQHKNKQYFPVVTDFSIQWQVRQWFQRVKRTENLSQRFEQELTHWFTLLPSAQSNFVAANFSGYQFGFSQAQLATRFKYSAYDGTLVQLDAIACLLLQLQQVPKNWPLCQQLLPSEAFLQLPLSRSTKATYALFQQGLTLSQICQSRRLKAGTVREHLLEAALLIPDFDVTTLLKRNDLAADIYFTDRLNEILELNKHEC
ncbi:helix-turn-helix domain-containing protein [Agrilactobacillus yilanensis]|uniref:Helix-turn-helix domain-containing protein n=1 Tax=Agrilactobacillus yilanensis TaxID=2485997 RepID=A0ABW4J6N5_9LACO|nr:helix-turn-helix domain-containing protein [Agrilactobacillus yilanensis]